MIDPDQALIAAIAAGDRQAFEQLYRAHKDDLLSLSRWMLADTTLAEDVVHDVFVSLARNAARLKVTGPIKNYLCVSCLNRSRDIMRQTQRQARNNQDLTPRLSDSVDPADAAAVAEQRQHLTAALDSLPAEQRQTVALRIYGQMTFREIGQATAVSINTVQSRYRYALSALQAALLAQ